MLPNLYTSHYGNYGHKPLKKELPKIIKLVKDESVRFDLKTSFVHYVMERAAVQKIYINFKIFEKVFLNLMECKETRKECIDYGDCCFAFSLYFYKFNIFPKKAYKYLKESLKYTMDDAHKYSRFILLAYFYFNGFGIKKNIDKGIKAIADAEKIFYKNKEAIIEGNLKIKR